MQAYPSANLHPRQLRSLWKSHDWIAQEKLNGCRVILNFVRGLGIFAHSRTINIRTYRRRELTNRLRFRSFIPPFSATLDTEALVKKPIDTRNFTTKGNVTRSSLQSTTAVLHLEAEASLRLQREQDAGLVLHAFDIVSWQGTDLRKRKLAERLGYLDEFQKIISGTELEQHFEFPPVVTISKEAFFTKSIAAGAEGVVLKNLSSRYEDNSSRNPRGWVKCKRSIELTAYVSGFEPARSKSRWSKMVGSLLFSVGTEKGPKLVAKCSNFPYQLRKELSQYDKDTGRVSMHPKILGQVSTITGQEFSARAFRLVHPSITYWRSDLRQEDCNYSQDELENLRAGTTGNTHRKVEGSVL